ncbi:MAG: serine hydrolase [Deltaproteobacteria bacterium]|nr:serine hydrolase [Deltaproteobacteria bacterium]
MGLDRARLDELVHEAEGNGSDSLVILKDGRVVVERYFGTVAAPIETMSVTKSVVSLAIGMLIDEGKIASVDAPVSTWFPEWKEGKRGKVTLRHLLTHTSGLEHKKGAAVLSSKPDRVKFARASKILDEPGRAFSYSNEATQLLSAIIKSAAGRPVDAYLRDKLFTPLGIKGWSWAHDKAENTLTYYGLALTARDLARLGMLMLAEGTWEGKSLLPAAYVHQATSAGIDTAQHYGLLWWLRHDGTERLLGREHIDALRAAGFASADKLQPLIDRAVSSDEAWFLEAGALLDPTERAQLVELKNRGVTLFATRPGKQLGYYADGWLGQKLGVYPASKVIAVRQHRRREGTEEENQKAGFSSFYKMLEAAVMEPRP